MSAVENLDTPQKEEQKHEVLQKLLERAGPGLTPCEKQAFFRLLNTYADIFAKSTADLG